MTPLVIIPVALLAYIVVWMVIAVTPLIIVPVALVAYIVVGMVIAAVYAARHLSSTGQSPLKADMGLILAGWPMVLFGLAMWGIFVGFSRIINAGVKALTRKFNPEFQDWREIRG